MKQDREFPRTASASTGAGSIIAHSASVATSSWKLAVDLVAADLFGHDFPDTSPDLLFVFISDHWAEHFAEILADLRERTGATSMIGGTGSAIVGDGKEHEGVPALSCLALWLPGVRVDLLRLHQESLPVLEEPLTWHEATGIDPSGVQGIIMVADPYRMDSNLLVQGLGRCYPGVPIVGGMTAGSSEQRRTWVFLDDHVYDEGGVALLLSGPVRLVPMVSQGGEPVGEAWTVTKVDHNTILEISNRPALDVLLDTAADIERASDHHALPVGDWMAGFAIDEYRDNFDRGDFVVQGILAIDQKRRGLVIGGAPRVGQTIQFQLRDADLADVDLHQHLLDLRAGLGDTSPVAGLLFTCNGRGKKLFGKPHHDAEAVRCVFRSIPLAGLFCNGEIGPGGRREETMLHGFSATLALIVPDDSHSS